MSDLSKVMLKIFIDSDRSLLAAKGGEGAYTDQMSPCAIKIQICSSNDSHICNLNAREYNFHLTWHLHLSIENSLRWQIVLI